MSWLALALTSLTLRDVQRIRLTTLQRERGHTFTAESLVTSRLFALDTQSRSFVLCGVYEYVGFFFMTTPEIIELPANGISLLFRRVTHRRR